MSSAVVRLDAGLLIVTGETREQALERARRAPTSSRWGSCPAPFHRHIVSPTRVCPATAEKFDVYTGGSETDWVNPIRAGVPVVSPSGRREAPARRSSSRSAAAAWRVSLRP